MGCPKNPLGVLDERLPFPDLPLIPSSMLLRTHGLRAGRSGRSRPSSQTFETLSGLAGFYPREPWAELELFCKDEVKAIP